MTRPLLIVDDEEAALFAMREYFGALGYEVDCASELGAAQQLLSARRYGVVIADLRLTPCGGTEGLELIAGVRERSPSTRTILLTAYGSPEVEAKARELGIDALLDKPQPLPQIARLVGSLLRGEP
jgi:DNA-binding response OmpR family regulator